jgi:hypothetical protein
MTILCVREVESAGEEEKKTSFGDLSVVLHGTIEFVSVTDVLDKFHIRSDESRGGKRRDKSQWNLF